MRGNEVAARLGVVHLKPVYKLIEEKGLTSQDGTTNGRLLVTKNSLGEYLGENTGERFFNSGYASDMTNISVRNIDRRALKYDIGRKVNYGERNSMYLFTKNDIEILRTS